MQDIYEAVQPVSQKKKVEREAAAQAARKTAGSDQLAGSSQAAHSQKSVEDTSSTATVDQEGSAPDTLKNQHNR